MNPDIRARVEQLLNDSSAYRQGLQDERYRLQRLIDIRIDQLHNTPNLCNRQQICQELLNIRQLLEP